mgnify:CR=1 FL=1
MVRHASWLPAVRAGEWTDAQTGVHSNLRGREGVNSLFEKYRFPVRPCACRLTPRPAPPQLIKGLLEHEVWEREEFAGASP